MRANETKPLSETKTVNNVSIVGQSVEKGKLEKLGTFTPRGDGGLVQQGPKNLQRALFPE